MANSRVARFVTEVAPPQFVCVMRQRTQKVLDTIAEEERDAGGTNETQPLSSKSYSSPVSASSSSSNYFLTEVQRSFSICSH
uniref:Uncharacterized protein n=1 Tax=Nelumbo nucifera TaxID=4432 RepID=A0A822Z335_NELNU|nr:TPA_asm: hypothetical protein HUJ06_008037 [Nelumbo nucifera]